MEHDTPPAGAAGPGDPLEEPYLGVGAAARRLGIAASTLRTWDRRYGMGPTGHVPGGHRRYSPDDVDRLEAMVHALTRGATPADAAQYALATRVSDPAGSHRRAEQAVRPDADAPTAVEAGAARQLARPWAPPPPDRVGAADPSVAVAQHGPPIGVGRRGGGLRMPGAGPLARGLAQAALALDAVAARELLRESVATSGVRVCWDEVARPVLSAVAQRWADTGTGIEIEHLLSECVIGVFTAAGAVTGPARNVRPVLLAGMAGEHHTLPLVVLSAALAQQRIACRSLGGDLPASSLVSAMRRTAPIVMLLWSQLAATADDEMLRSLPRLRPAVRTFVAGPGWAGSDLPPRISWLQTLDEAVQVIAAAVS